MKINLALAQINTRLGDVEGNLEKHLALVKEARGRGADLLVFPELSLTGYVLQDLVPTVAHSATADEPVFRPLLEASHANGDLVVLMPRGREARRGPGWSAGTARRCTT